MWIDGHTHLTDPPERLLERMNALGIEQAIVCSSAVCQGEKVTDVQSARKMMHDLQQAQGKPGSRRSPFEINRELLASTGRYRPRLIPFGKVDLYREDLPEQLEDMDALNVPGIGEVVGIHGQVDRLEPVLRYSHEHNGLPLFIHTDYPVDGQDLAELFALMRKINRSRVIIGHLGGNFWLDAVEQALSTPGCILDISEAVNAVAVRVAVRAMPDRVTFGSDYPWDDPQVNLARLEVMDLTSGEMDGIMGKNLQRFLEPLSVEKRP